MENVDYDLYYLSSEQLEKLQILAAECRQKPYGFPPAKFAEVLDRIKKQRMRLSLALPE